MYFITEPNDLIGKEIGFIHANQFCDSTTIVTKDGGVLIVKQVFDLDEDQTNTIVFNECRAKKSYMRTDMQNTNSIELKSLQKDWADYELRLKKQKKLVKLNTKRKRRAGKIGI